MGVLVEKQKFQFSKYFALIFEKIKNVNKYNKLLLRSSGDRHTNFPIYVASICHHKESNINIYYYTLCT